MAMEALLAMVGWMNLRQSLPGWPGNAVELNVKRDGIGTGNVEDHGLSLTGHYN